MKPLLILSIALMLRCTVYGQSVALQSTTLSCAPGFLLKPVPGDDPRFRLCAETKVGFGITVAGVITGCVGIEIYTANSRKNDIGRNELQTTGAATWLVGGVVALLGSVLSVDGSLHDMHRYYKTHKFTLSASKANQFGVAYNF